MAKSRGYFLKGSILPWDPVKEISVLYRMSVSGRRCGLMVSSLDLARWIEQPGFEPWPGSLCCVLWQGTLLSQHLSLASTQEYKTSNKMLGGNLVLD